MVKKFTCTFCGTDVEPGTGSIYVKNDGSLFYLCSSKCRRNQTLLKRTARRLKWTEVYEERTRRRAQAARKRKKAKAKAKPKAKTPAKKETKPTPPKKAAKPKAKKPAKKSKTKSKTKKE
jgi:large subunit ribosomal protein L24e